SRLDSKQGQGFRKADGNIGAISPCCNDAEPCHLDIKVLQDKKPDRSAGSLSDFFLASYTLLFPESYTQELYDFFGFLIHPYRRCFDTPAASPKNEEIESAMKNKGHEGCCTFFRENNCKFIVHPLRDWMFQPHRHH